MKTQLLLIVLLLGCVVSFAEQVPVIDESGNIEIIEKTSIQHELTPQEKQAYQNPGTEVPIISSAVKYEKEDFFYLQPYFEYTEVMVYQDGKIETISKSGRVEKERMIAFYVFFSFIAIALMVLSNLLFYFSKSYGVIAFVSVSAFAFATFTAFFAFVFALVSASASALATSAFVFASFDGESNKKRYWLYSILFYISIAIVLFV